MVESSETASLSWRIQQEGELARVHFSGEMNETTDFSELAAWLSGPVEFNLEEVSHINSIGTREWIRFVRGLAGVSVLTLACCSIAVVRQLNLISNFGGDAQIRSFYAPYRCSGCHEEVVKLIWAEMLAPKHLELELPIFTCELCSEPLRFDDLEEYYMGFFKRS